MLLERVGVNINDPDFWQGGLNLLREMVDEALVLADRVNGWKADGQPGQQG